MASSVRLWWLAARPFALPASTMPVVLGTVIAVTAGGAAFRPLLFAASLLAMVLLHSGANMVNDVVDWRRGLDREVDPGSGAIVRGLLSWRQVLAGAVTLLAAGVLIGLLLVLAVGWPLLVIGLVGVALGVFYTAPPLSLKYRALGDLVVFLDFGILGALGAWIVQRGTFDWRPVVWAVPVSLLVVGILHANNWRDRAADRAGGVRTLAGLLGERGSRAYYFLLLFGPYLFVTVLAAGRALFPSILSLPPEALVVYLCLPPALGAWRLAGRRGLAGGERGFVALDQATAQLNLAFGLLYALGLLWGG